MASKADGPSKRPSITDQEALQFHSRGRPGKLEITPTKPMATQRDLSLAYSPGVAVPVKAIAADPSTVYDYTARGNMVAVITNGTAILGLGNLGALASKPVMEGKAVLFKRFADVNSIDLEVDTEDPEEFINAVKYLGPSFGGINLEDIKAPECFIIEERLREMMDIPVFHDDQHGTAIIAAAGMINAIHLTGRDVKTTRLVCNGAGAAGIACLDLIKHMGFEPRNVMLCDTKGVVYRGREAGMNQWKSAHAVDTPLRTLEEAMVGADIFFGLSAKGALTPEMVKTMAPNPIIFAMANPDPEITPEDAQRVRDDVIIATGRSDYPNQVNNVLGFPYIFRGALDVRAKTINMEMKIAATRALAELAREDVPDEVASAYRGSRPRFGREYIIPVPFDPRLIHVVPIAVAKAAMESGRRAASDRRSRGLQGAAVGPARSDRRRHAADHRSRAANAEASRVRRRRGGAGHPRRLFVRQPGARLRHPGRPRGSGARRSRRRPASISPTRGSRSTMRSFLTATPDTRSSSTRSSSAGASCCATASGSSIRTATTSRAAMVAEGDADAMVTGVTRNFSVALEEVRRVIDDRPGHRVVGVSIIISHGRPILVADTAITEMPNAEDLAEIAIEAAGVARRLGYEPRVAMLAFSNFGHPVGERGQRVQEAVRILDSRRVDFEYDGEMGADVALNRELMAAYPFCRLTDTANVLVMPAFHSAAISTRMLQELGGAMVLGPLIVGLEKSVQIVSLAAKDSDIVNMAALASFNIGG